ncbi:MAG: DUF4340 domain-containing protein [Opitutae bacterium]|nr:DUF4340 domain-containing protein [Opitutae bacterium]
MRNIKTTLIVLNIIFILFIYYKIDNSTIDKYKLQHEITDLSKVYRIDISNNDKKVTVVKKDFTWDITSPFAWKVDNYSISNFKTIFSHLSFSEIFTVQEISERGEIINDYGINEHSPRIVLHRAKNTTTIQLGKSTRDKKFIYCIIDYANKESAKIWRVSEQIKELVNIPLKGWADTNLIRCGLYEIDDITVSFKSNNNSTTTTSIVKHQNGWHFREPFKAKANDDQVRFLINNILSEQISEFVKDENNITHDNIQDRWTLNFTINNSGKKHEFNVSKEYNTDSTPFRLCKSSYSPHLFKISENFLTNFSNWSTKLRERSIFQLNTEKLSKLKIINKYNNFELVKITKDNWIIKTEPGSIYNGDYANIITLLQNLNSIEIKEFLSFNPSQNELKSINKFEDNYVIQAHCNDTSIRTVLINKNKLNASLWKIFSVENSLLCLVDDELNKVLELMIYELKDRNVINNKKINNIEIIDLESNRTIKNTRSDIDDSLHKEFKNLKVQSFLSNEGKEDGTWNDGDWVPWRYKILLNQQDNNRTRNELTIMTSDVLGANKLVGKFTDSNLTFNLPINLINRILSLKKNSNSTSN